MDTELTISFFPATDALQEEPCITVQAAENSLYTVVEDALRLFTGWFTVTVQNACRATIRRMRAYIRKAVQISGLRILRKIAILRI